MNVIIRRVQDHIFLVILNLMLLLSSCVSFRQASALRQLNSFLENLPIPQESILLDTINGVDGGSDKRCYTLYVRQLYGTDQQFSDIVAFYEEKLTSIQSWQIAGGLRNEDRSWIAFKHTDGFRMSIIEGSESSNSLLQPSFSEDIISEGLSQFTTLYLLSISYADVNTRSECWASDSN